MLAPKKVKHRKCIAVAAAAWPRAARRSISATTACVALEAAWITNRQIEAARVAITRHIRRGGKVWINIFPDKPVTKKPAETRMGSGKGNPEGWVAVVKPGRVMFELAGVPEPLAREAMKRAQHKLPIKTKFISRWGSRRCPARPRSSASCRTTSSSCGSEAPKEELFNLRFQLATGQLDNPSRHRGGPPRRWPDRHDAREREIERSSKRDRPRSERKRGTRVGAGPVSDERDHDRAGPPKGARPVWSCPTRWTRPSWSASIARCAQPVPQDRAAFVQVRRARRGGTTRTWATPSA